MASENETTVISLDGDWVVSTINQQMQCLIGRRKAAPAVDGSPIVIDMSSVESLDASGCQLLASFVKVIEKDGLKPRLASMPASFQELFESLGYAESVRTAE